MMRMIMAVVMVAVMAVVTVSSLSPDSCLLQVFLASQRCDNAVRQFTPLLGLRSGLGSEFEAFLMTSLMYAVMSRRRLVYLQTPEKLWPYDCPEKKGWSCYFSWEHMCADSVISTLHPWNASQLVGHRNLSASILLKRGRKDFVMLPHNNGWLRQAAFYHAWTGKEYHPAFSSLPFNEFEPPHDTPKAAFLREVYHEPVGKSLLESYQNDGLVSRNCIDNVSIPEFEVFLTRYLYRLNAKTSAAVQSLNQELYPELFSSLHRPPEYISLQLRLTDKVIEMDSAKWKWMNNISNIAHAVMPFLNEHCRRIFVATDNCHAVQTLRGMLPPSVHIHSSCLLESHTLSRLKHRIGTERNFLGAVKLFADIEMLRGGQHFIGNPDSNVVRLARRLMIPKGTFHKLGG